MTQATDSISELFARQPPWNEEDLDRIIKYNRELRVKLLENEKVAKRAAVAKVPVEDLKGIAAGDLLNKLGLDSL